MAESQAQKLASLTLDVKEIETEHAELDRNLERLESDLDAAKLQIVDLRTKVATLEERCASLQRLSDRGWGLWQAILVLAISVAASAVTQLALRK